MELDILKAFIKLNVEVVVDGVCFCGLLAPIAKGIVVIIPFPEDSEFYGPASMHYSDIKAIRQIKRHPNSPVAQLPELPTEIPNIRSSLETLPPNFRFPVKKPGQL